MKRFHHSLRLWFTTLALTAALLDSQFPLLAAEVVAPPPDPSPAADADSGKAEISPTPAEPEAFEGGEAIAPAVAAPASSPTPAAAAPSPTAQSPASTAQTIRLEAARQRVEAHLAAIVERDRAAKAAQLQQNLVAAALRSAEAGNLEQARRTAAHPALPEAMQADTLAKIAAIEALRTGAIAVAAAANVPTTATATTPTPATAAQTAPAANARTPARRVLPPVPARVTRFARLPFRPAIENRCLPRQQANLLSVAAPKPIAAESAIAPLPIKAIGTPIYLKAIASKATVQRTVTIPESIELRSRDQAVASVQAIEVKLKGLAAAIPTLVKQSPAAVVPPSSPVPSLSGLVSTIVKVSQQANSSEALPSLPVVYVDAKVNRSQSAQPAAVPAVATNCDSALATVRYSARSSLQGLAQLGLAFPLPIPAAITSAFGWRIHPISGDRRFHAGVDFGAPMGTPVLAALPGQVVVAGDRGGYGLTVILENQGHRNLYAHLSAIAVQPGQVVNAGNVIGWVGSTGNSTGPHLHFESQYLTAQGWQAVDPLDNDRAARQTAARQTAASQAAQ